MDLSFWNVFITGIVGLLGVFVGWLKPVIDWKIESRRRLIDERKEFLKRTREKVEKDDFQIRKFIYSAEYAQLRRYLPKERHDVFEIVQPPKKTSTRRRKDVRYTYRHGEKVAILDALAALELQWGLL